MAPKHRPGPIIPTADLPPQAQVTTSDDGSKVEAKLVSGETISVLLFGATVTSWKDASGDEKLWLSDAAKLDGSKAVRGGIPLVFPVFGTAPDHEATSKLPQHGFARNSKWNLLGHSSSEGDEAGFTTLDFGLSSGSLDAETKALWPYEFRLQYSVTLSIKSLRTTLLIVNEGDASFEFQTLLHTYFKIKDITSVKVGGLEESSYVDKVDAKKTKTETSGSVSITGETDRVYTPTKDPIEIYEGSTKSYSIARENLDDVVLWNPWDAKAASMADFAPKDGWKGMVCVEAGSVSGWQKLEVGDTFEGSQTISLE